MPYNKKKEFKIKPKIIKAKPIRENTVKRRVSHNKQQSFKSFLDMVDREETSTEDMRRELKSIGFNEKGISAVWNTDSLYGSDKKKMKRDLMSILNKPEYRQ